MSFIFLKDNSFNKAILHELSNADVAMATIEAQQDACRGEESSDQVLNGYGLNKHQNNT